MAATKRNQANHHRRNLPQLEYLLEPQCHFEQPLVGVPRAYRLEPDSNMQLEKWFCRIDFEESRILQNGS
jgi:hypothetical protein